MLSSSSTAGNRSNRRNVPGYAQACPPPVNMPSELYTLPIPARPPHPTPLRNRLLLFPIVLAGVLVILGVQACFIPVAIASRGWSILRRLLRMREEGTWLGDVYEWGVKRTKQMFGMLRMYPSVSPACSLPSSPVILVTVLFAPTSITLTSDASLPLKNILVRPSPGNKHGLTYLKLPTDLVIMSNHQAYLDWIFIWILGHLSMTPDAGTAGDEYHHGSRSLIILLKRSLKWVPLVGWGMQVLHPPLLVCENATDTSARTGNSTGSSSSPVHGLSTGQTSPSPCATSPRVHVAAPGYGC